MSNTLGYFLLGIAALAGVIISLCDPILISDRNTFLKGFVDADLLNILGVIFAITAASASNIHLELRRLEAMYQPDAFLRTRREVKRGAFALVYLFVAAAALMLLKPIFADGLCSQALFNSAAILILLWNVLVLVGLLELSFKVGPIIIDYDDAADEPSISPASKGSAGTSVSKIRSAGTLLKPKAKPVTRAPNVRQK
ncbi:hypothetical protein [Mesorhizobium sp. M0870]|uniref:hypothetical protein n=1 Tax=Mesorhizobium sp. M0870 TaxID=2957016 RepID=UPI0033383398